MAVQRFDGDPPLDGLLLGIIGVGAVAGAFGLPRLGERLGADALIGMGTIGSACALFLFGQARTLPIGILASLLAGMSWILAPLNVSAQLALPGWVRGRGLAVYATAMFGSMTLGGLIWGQIAAAVEVSAALYIAAAGSLLLLPMLHRWKVQSGPTVDLSPSMHWPDPIIARKVDDDRGPVLVTVEYRIAPMDKAQFLTAMYHIEAERRRDGAYRWGIYGHLALRSVA